MYLLLLSRERHIYADAALARLLALEAARDVEQRALDFYLHH